MPFIGTFYTDMHGKAHFVSSQAMTQLTKVRLDAPPPSTSHVAFESQRLRSPGVSYSRSCGCCPDASTRLNHLAIAAAAGASKDHTESVLKCVVATLRREWVLPAFRTCSGVTPPNHAAFPMYTIGQW